MSETAENQAIEISTVAAGRVDMILAEIDSIVIADDEHRLQIHERSEALDIERSKFDEQYHKLRDPAWETYNNINKMFNPVLKSYDLIKKKLKGKIINYNAEQKRIRQVEQEKLRLQAEAEAKREKEALEKRAAKWEEKGNAEKADLLREQKETVHKPVTIIPKAEKLDGFRSQTRWKARPANGKQEYDLKIVPTRFHLIDEKKLNKRAMSDKTTECDIPGVEFYKVTV